MSPRHPAATDPREEARAVLGTRKVPCGAPTGAEERLGLAGYNPGNRLRVHESTLIW